MDTKRKDIAMTAKKRRKAQPAKTKTVSRKSTKSSAPAKVALTSPSFLKSAPVINFMEMKMTNNKQYEKITSDAAAMGQEQMDAFVKSSTIFAKGMEGVMKTCMDMAQSSAEKAQAAAKTMMTCKTINELTEAQSKFAQASFDEFMTGANKISEMSVKLATECMEPINGQMGKAIKKASQAA